MCLCLCLSLSLLPVCLCVLVSPSVSAELSADADVALLCAGSLLARDVQAKTTSSDGADDGCATAGSPTFASGMMTNSLSLGLMSADATFDAGSIARPACMIRIDGLRWPHHHLSSRRGPSECARAEEERSY